MIQGKILSYSDSLSEVYDIRKKVFIDELEIPEEYVFDEYDKNSLHVVVYEGIDYNNAVGAGRINYDGNIYTISQVAILKEFRGKKYGDFVLRMLLNKAFVSGATKVYLITQLEVIDFYKKIGFQLVKNSYNAKVSRFVKMIIRSEELKKPCCKS